MVTRFVLECQKTGRHWIYASEGQCLHAARYFGLSDYSIERIEK